MMRFLKHFKIPMLLFVACCLFYLSFAYGLERSDFFKLLGLYTALFLLSWKLISFYRGNINILLAATIIFRLLFLLATPNLSQDFYRFLWDGNLLLEGMNPYVSLPNDLIDSGNVGFNGAEALFQGMGSLSAGNPTSYPPLNQLFFMLAAYLGQKSILAGIIWLRIFIIAADLGIFYFGRKLLQQLKLPEHKIFYYLLNPLIIIELTGNLHFEGVMLFFLLAGLYLLQRQKWFSGALLFACSVAVKLIPLMFLPLLIRKLGWKKAIMFYVVVAVMLLLFFLPFLSQEFLNNFFSSINLWFQKFEFNASIYYLLRWVGFEVRGYNLIAFIGPALAILVFLAVLLFSNLKRNKRIRGLLTSMMFAATIYLFLATTVHPWYLATPLFLSVFTRYRFMQVWSLTVILSYYAYSQENFEENLWLLSLEYIVVLGVMGIEIFRSSFQKGTDEDLLGTKDLLKT